MAKEELVQDNMIDATLRAFLSNELTYFKSVGFTLLENKPKYTPEIDFEAAFIDDAKIFENNFQTILNERVGDSRKVLSPWVAMAWNRDAVMPSLRRRNQRKLTYIYFDSKLNRTRQSVLRLCETNLLICMFCNTHTILGLLEQRNLVDRGHDYPMEININNTYITKGLNITATYPWQHEMSPMTLGEHGGIVSLQYGVRLTFPVISPRNEDAIDFKKIRLKIDVG